MGEEFLIYRRFTDEEEASFFIYLLKENNIDFRVEDLSNRNDVIFTTAESSNGIYIKIAPTDFEKVNSLEKTADFKTSEERVNFFKEFDNEDLIEIVQNSNEWDFDDIEIVKRILKERGNIKSEEDVSALKNAKIEKLKEGKDGETFWVVFGFISSILGGLIGLILGIYYNTDKTIAPNGVKYFTYKPATRKTGLYMFYIAVVSISIYIILWVKHHFYNGS